MKNTQTKLNTAKAGLLAASVLFALPNAGNLLQAQNNAKSSDMHIKMSNADAKTISNLKYSEIFIKIRDEWKIVGMEQGTALYKNAKGQYFTIDPNTGDMKFISSDFFMKFDYIKANAARTANKLTHIKFEGIKGEMKVTVLGVDPKGNVIQQNSKGEKFFLDAMTGDMVFVK